MLPKSSAIGRYSVTTLPYSLPCSPSDPKIIVGRTRWWRLYAGVDLSRVAMQNCTLKQSGVSDPGIAGNGENEKAILDGSINEHARSGGVDQISEVPGSIWKRS